MYKLILSEEENSIEQDSNIHVLGNFHNAIESGLEIVRVLKIPFVNILCTKTNKIVGVLKLAALGLNAGSTNMEEMRMT